jgi:hypothetical protein
MASAPSLAAVQPWNRYCPTILAFIGLGNLGLFGNLFLSLIGKKLGLSASCFVIKLPPAGGG